MISEKSYLSNIEEAMAFKMTVEPKLNEEL